MNVTLVKAYRFEAAHETLWGGATCLHGHSYLVELVVGGECDPRLGWLMDYAEIGARFDGLHKAVDHRLLNEVEGLEDPTLEGLRQWLKTRLAERLEGLQDLRVAIAGARTFLPEMLDAQAATALPARIRFGFEAAHALPRLPEGHKCRRMHGHSFTVEIGAEGLLNRGHSDVSSAIRRVYDRLDHQCLNRIEGLENPTSEEVCRWIWNEVSGTLPGMEVVIVAETCTARCAYHGK